MRHIAYIKYLAKHKTRVLVHSICLGIPLQGVIHDTSKLTHVEYFGIGRQFFPSTPLEKDRNGELFQQAKAHHNARNRHHLEHYYNEDGTCREIPIRFCKEIICDWAAVQGCAFASAGIRKLAKKSYENWGKGFRMHPATRQWFIEYLEVEHQQ